MCLLGLSLLLVANQPAAAQRVNVNFKDLTLDPESYYNGSDGAGYFTSHGAWFNNSYNPMYDSWSGWSYSNTTDETTGDFTNQYSAYNLPNGGGYRGANFGVAYNFNVGDAVIQLPQGTAPLSMRVTNTTYGAIVMRDGNQFAKKFGGDDGTDPDYFILSVIGLDYNNQVTGTVGFFLADYTFGDPNLNYIVSEWTEIDLRRLGAATWMAFQLTSSDNGPFGMNTPAYFAMDNLVLGPTP
jgi:hypothetical protein